ncbi:hypothetical protein LTR99_003876 [Exophiala xenobiotica]|uniref:Protein kinase domain-containing protein n=1 Tax=Vermiconidia calcicola TaxID=1690605 RepID=A0AAV9PXR6_9PEZI|nr:hypothetical protein LTR92_009807 [Exophiala xenobiotica]KAK5529804.1 hypothetical protein LTR25_009584 [Vermiconidia calcicola]KAK5548991.1 hypothetical protein LTR23_000820 [Chaetothyriales sp. CCFEE 6169]KAK5268711.1 hypothetical protein LTR96_006419 [Exophiala xenobiotica]KAK5304811.1 hypothetical protein LTR99_003876 [Exophiala xenobiotica]
MADSTWINPYKLSLLERLSSQGTVYELDGGSVIKVPVQYPVDNGSNNDEKTGHLMQSLKAFNYFKQECRIYDLLSKHPHPNVVASFQCSKPDCLVLERIKPLEDAWNGSTEHLRGMWILELLDVVSFLEDLDYLHGDITIFNMGVDHENRLKIFDFGSAVHVSGGEFGHQILEDQFDLATCIFFLASGIDPFAEAQSFADLNRVRQDLQQCKYPFPAAAQRFQGVIEACWSQRQPTSFKQLRQAVADVTGISELRATRIWVSQAANPSLDLLLGRLRREEGWMNEEEYRSAWSNAGFKVPPLV